MTALANPFFFPPPPAAAPIHGLVFPFHIHVVINANNMERVKLAESQAFLESNTSLPAAVQPFRWTADNIRVHNGMDYNVQHLFLINQHKWILRTVKQGYCIAFLDQNEWQCMFCNIHYWFTCHTGYNEQI